MSKKVEVKVIEIEANKLNPNAKYIFMLDPSYADYYKHICEELEDLIPGNFTVIPIPASHLKVVEVLPKTGVNMNV